MTVRPTDSHMNLREQATDELLVLRCQGGDAAAFGELIDRWQERLWRHAWRLTENRDAAWDVMQDAWISISRDIGRLSDAAAFPSWAYRIVSSRCYDWIRRESRRRRTDRQYAEATSPVERQASSMDASSELAEALSRMRGPDRAILSLRYLEGFDLAEIAEILRIPTGTAKSRLHYARERLRQEMEKPNHE